MTPRMTMEQMIQEMGETKRLNVAKGPYGWEAWLGDHMPTFGRGDTPKAAIEALHEKWKALS